MFGETDVLRPQIHLRSQDILALLFGQLLRHGFQTVHLAHRHVATDTERLRPVVLQLVIVDVAIVRRSHDDTVVLAGSLDAALHASPRHDDAVLAQSALQCLVPTDDGASLGSQVLVHFAVDVGLQLRLPRETQFFHLRLTLGAILPAHARTLVASDVDEFRGEHVAQFVIHPFQELQRLGVAGTKHVLGDAPDGPHLVGTARAAQFGIDMQRAQHVTGQVNLGNHVDKTLRGVLHNLAAVPLRVIAAVGLAVVDARVAPQYRLLPDRTLFGKFGHRLHFEPPSLILGQVPVELIAAVQSQEVDVSLNEIQGEEVARSIEVDTPIGKARLVLHRHVWQGYALAALDADGLTQGLHPTEHAALRGTTDDDALLAHRQFVSVGIVILQSKAKHDGSPFAHVGLHPQFEVRILTQVFRQQFGAVAQGLVLLVIRRHGTLSQIIHLALRRQFHATRTRNHIITHLSPSKGGHHAHTKKRKDSFHSILF